MENKDYLSLQEVAKILGISRIAVYKKVKKGDIKAIRAGRSFAVSRKYVDNIFGKELKSADKIEIDKAVKRTVKEYGEVLKRLGKD